MNSFSAISIERPPTSPLLRWMAMLTLGNGKAVGPSRVGSTVTWYCLTKPPMLRDLGHAFHGRELVFEIPVLHRAQLREAAVG